MRCDVAIVGAGISGLACAAALSANGITAVIFEARDIVGGRLRTYRPPDGGPVLELGAQVIHGDRNPLRDPAALAFPAAPGFAAPGFPAAPASPPAPGLPAAPAFLPAPGLPAGSLRSQLVPRDAAARAILHGRIMPLGLLATGGMPPWAVEQRLAADGGQPGGWSDGRAGGEAGGAEFDDDSDAPVAAWLAAQLAAQRISGDQLLAAAEWFRQNWAAEPRILSARGVAAARRGDCSGDGEYALEQGYSSLAGALAAALDVRLRAPVRALAWAPGQVELTTGDGVRATARAVVITAPPPVITGGRLAITPLPERKAAAARALPAGDGLCAVAVLPRAAPESAVVFDADGQGGFVRCTAGRPEVLIVAKARAAAAVRSASLAALVSRVFPGWAAAGLTGAQVADWGRDPWSGGAFSYPRVGAAGAGPAWAAPVQRTLFFAGEATTAGSRPPTVHGALDSGLRAASEVMEAWGR